MCASVCVRVCVSVCICVHCLLTRLLCAATFVVIALKVFVANGVLLGYEVVVKDSDNNDQIVSVRSSGEPQYLH